MAGRRAAGIRGGYARHEGGGAAWYANTLRGTADADFVDRSVFCDLCTPSPSERMRPWADLIDHWGSTPTDREQPFPCDGLVPEPRQVLFRAVDVQAPAAVVFRWLCQLRVAPYSYDWVDNLGRRSPRRLTPGAERLERGQRFMTVFRLESFEVGRSVTILAVVRPVGRVAVTYRVTAAGAETSRLVAKLSVAYAGGPLARLAAVVLPLGDLVMMRRQLLNLKALAQQQPAPA